MVAERGSKLGIGVPRSILHYEFGGTIARFLSHLGAEVVLSPPTNQAIFQAGKRVVIDELCFPIKIFAGHVAYLTNQDVDKILVPVIVGHENNRVFPCHPRSRLVDIVRALGICEVDRLLAPAFRFNQDGLTVGGFRELAQLLGFSEGECDRAFEAISSCAPNEPRTLGTSRDGLTIGIVGRPYVVQDKWANNRVIQRLETVGCQVVTEDDAEPVGYAPEETGLHFALAARTVMLTRMWDSMPEIDGIVFLLPFNCGPDGDIARFLHRTIKTPMLTLVLDELQSSAGLITRIEAFVDLLNRSCAVVGGRSS
ncbi:acyl-CoA dehydratase activase-related protein [Candidatus Bipolaricaulota bacterium]